MSERLKEREYMCVCVLETEKELECERRRVSGENMPACVRESVYVSERVTVRVRVRSGGRDKERECVCG